MKGKIDTSKRSSLKALGALSVASIAGTALASETSTKISWDESYEIVIVGSGFAGLAAAVEAHRKGAKKIVVLEKMPYFGGNSVVCHGNANFVGTELQKKYGVEDSEELLFQDQMKASRGYNHPDVLRHIISLGNYCYEMTKDCGVEYTTIQHSGGSSVPRSHGNKEQNGAGMIRPMLKTVQSHGTETRVRAKFEKLLFDNSGKVAGIRVRQGYIFGKESSGKVINIQATGGVIMATGGFSQNVELRKSHDPGLTSDVGCTNAPGATGDGLIEMINQGANPIHLSFIQMGPWASPDEKGFGVCAPFSLFNFPHGIAVDIKTGKRFMNELADRKVRADAIMTHRDEQHNPIPPILFASVEHAKQNYSYDNVIKAGVGWKFESAEAMAKHFNIPLKPLNEQIELWNSFVAKGVDDQFGKPMDFAKKMGQMKGPLIAIRLWPKVHYCQGGVEINTKAEVISMQTNQPIPGLYAAGEVAGGVHGASRLGACSVPDCLAMGITAARSIMDKA